MPTLYIIRHGKAHKDSPTGLDQDRELQTRGEAQAAWLAETIVARADRPCNIIASRFTRALCTAKPIATALRLPLRTAPELESGRDPADALGLLSTMQPEAPLALVGHNFQLSDLIGLLIEGRPTRGSWARPVELRTGQAAILDTGNPIQPAKCKLLELLRMPGDDID